MKITVETLVNAARSRVWAAWNSPDDIRQWNSASADWHTTKSAVDLREGGEFSARMEAKDGSMGFDFAGVYTRVVPESAIEYRMGAAGDPGGGREVQVVFLDRPGGILVRETFDAESQNPPEFQRQGWQAILDNFRRHVEAKG